MTGWNQRTLLVDNYDSFTWNLVEAFRRLGDDPIVIRNDAVDVDLVTKNLPLRLVLSPGPMDPERSGRSLAVLRSLWGRVPILGVCLGHQCIAHLSGMSVERAPSPIHGKTSVIEHDGKGLYRSLSAPFVAARYHSLAVHGPIPADLEVSSWTHDVDGDRIVMGLRSKSLPIEGVQFHPESFLTPEGPTLLAEFLSWRL